MSLPGSSSRGNQAFSPAEGPGLLPDTCTPSPACHCFLLQCLRAVGRNRPVWPGAGYRAPVCCLLPLSPAMGGCTPLQPHSPGQLLWAPTHPWGVPGSPHQQVQASPSSEAEIEAGGGRGSHKQCIPEGFLGLRKEAPSLETFKVRLGEALSNHDLVEVVPAHCRGVGPDDL